MKHNKKILAVIPARMGSSRFPGKPLAEIHGKPMIGHVYDNVKSCDIITNLVVATCDNEIYNYIEKELDPYICGDLLTAADFYLYMLLRWDLYKNALYQDRPKLKSFANMMRNRPSVVTVLDNQPNKKT